MSSGIYVAMTGARAQEKALDVTANNVANASTTGFKAERLAFAEALTQARGQDQHFAVATAGKTDPTLGPLASTGNPLDLALVSSDPAAGSGEDAYFAIETPRGVRYTRAGAFHRSDDGTIVNGDGLPARAAGGGTVLVPPEAVVVNVRPDGVVEADGVEVGALEIARIVPGGLLREGANLFAAPAGAVTPAEGVEVRAGVLEGSNFNVVRGVVDLVRITRTFEALHRMIESYRDIDARTARDVGSPT